MHKGTNTRPTIWRLPVVIAIAIAIVMTGCAPTPSEPGTPPASFCGLWDEVDEAPAELDEPVVVADEVVAIAESAARHGDGCADPTAEVALDEVLLAEESSASGAALQKRSRAAAADGDGATDPMLAGKQIAAEATVLDNITIDSLSASITWTGITIRGSASVQLSGVTSVVGFIGTVRDLNNWSIQVSSSAFTLPGITSTPATFSGSLNVVYGVPTLTLNAGITQADIGDISVRGASVSLTASQANGVSAAVSGSIDIGTNTVAGTLDVRFDAIGTLVSLNAELDLELRGWKAGGGQVRLDGRVFIEGTADETTIWFRGNGAIDGLQVDDANGSLKIVGDRITFDGAIDARVEGFSVRYRGQIIFDGQTVTTPFIDLQAAGQHSGRLGKGQLLTVDGKVELTTGPGGEVRTFVNGSFKIGSLQGTGSAQVLINGPRTLLDIEITLDGDGLDGARLTGEVVLIDGYVEDLELGATVQRLDVGVLEVSDAELGVRAGFNEPIDIELSGDFDADDLATGSFEASVQLNPDGSLATLKGAADADLALDGTDIGVTASLLASSTSLTLDAAGTVRGAVDVDVQGVLSVPLGRDADWSFTGVARLEFGFLKLDPITISIRPGSFETIHFGFYFFFATTDVFVRASLVFNGNGSLQHLKLHNSFGIFTGLVADSLSDELGFPVVA